MTSFIGQFVHPVGEKGMFVKDVDGEGIVIIASYKIHFIRVHDNLVLDPSNNKSIAKI